LKNNLLKLLNHSVFTPRNCLLYKDQSVNFSEGNNRHFCDHLTRNKILSVAKCGISLFWTCDKYDNCKLVYMSRMV